MGKSLNRGIMARVTATKLDGNLYRDEIFVDLAARVAALKKKGIVPGLATVLVGDDPGSHSYVKMKHRDCEQIGVNSIRKDLPADITQEELFAVIDELNYVCEDAFGFICGHIFYTHAKVMADDGQVFPVISFGPISVHPDYQKKGIGSTLIQMTMKKAKEMKCSGIIITGNPEYYHRFGFRDASDFNIVFEDGSSFPAFLACELEPNALGQVHGRIQFCPEFSSIEQDALLRFDQQFPKKERLKLPSQLH